MVKYKEGASQCFINFCMKGARLLNMFLAVAATEIERAPLLSLARFQKDRAVAAVCGVGPVESAVLTARLLERYRGSVTGVIAFGIGGAYLADDGRPAAGLLDICLAEKEYLGDFGVCFGNRVEQFENENITAPHEFLLDRAMTERAESLLAEEGIACIRGNFVTVNGASGTAARGQSLRARFGGLCENMEGAAIARVCKLFSVPMIEIRAISNLVEDRPGSPWKVSEACQRAAEAVSVFVQSIRERP